MPTDLTAAEFVEVMETVPREFWPEGWGKVEYAPETPDRTEGIDVWPTDNMPWPNRFTVDVAVAVAGWAMLMELRARGRRPSFERDGLWYSPQEDGGVLSQKRQPGDPFRALAAAARAVGGGK